MLQLKKPTVAWLMDFINSDYEVTEDFLTEVEDKMSRLTFDASLEFTQKRLLFIYSVLLNIEDEFKEIKTDELTKPLMTRVETINKNVRDLKNVIENKVLTLINKEIDGLIGELDSVQNSGIAGVSKAFVGELKDNMFKIRPEIMDLKSKKDYKQIAKVTSRVKILEELYITLKARASSVVFNRLYTRLNDFTGSRVAGVIAAFEL